MNISSTPWNQLSPRRDRPERILQDLLEHRVRWIDQGRCGACDAALPVGGAWCWMGPNAPARCELRHAADPTFGALYPSELDILLPWLDEQKASKGTRDFTLASLSAMGSPKPKEAPPAPRRSKWGYFFAGCLGFVLGGAATALLLIGLLNGVPFG